MEIKPQQVVEFYQDFLDKVTKALNECEVKITYIRAQMENPVTDREATELHEQLLVLLGEIRGIRTMYNHSVLAFQSHFDALYRALKASQEHALTASKH